MLTKILLGLGVLVLALAAFIALRPAEFRIARSATFAAPPAAVFAKVNDFHQWEAWSPWAKLDPAMKQTYEGAPAGVGAIYSWSGNGDVGAGRMTMTQSHPDDLIRIELQFLRPVACTNITEFTFIPTNGRTTVVWSMSGRNNFAGKAFDLFMNMDKTVGADFEKGLAQLQALVAAPKP